MMSRAKHMREATQSGTTAFLQFTRIHASKPSCLFCFFEGEDDKYYGTRIKERLDIDWESIRCGGKQAVLNVYSIFSKHENLTYQNTQKTFFVDRDFDDPLTPELRQAIYETPCYAIENFYTTIDCFKNILKIEFKIDEFGNDSVLFEKCLDFFKQTQQAFHTAIVEFNAWVKVARKKKVYIDTSDYDAFKKINKLVRIEVRQAQKVYEMNDLLAKVKTGCIHAIEISPIKEQLLLKDGCTFRGKQELLFFIKFLIKLKEVLCSQQRCADHFGLNKPRKVSYEIPTSNSLFLSALTQHADTPECLKHYLEKFQ